MASHYRLIHYVPDPVADERLNVGVIVVGDGRVLTRTVSHWSRARAFGREAVGFLKDFARDLENRQLPLIPEGNRLTEDALEKIASRWRNSIQFSEARASLKNPDELMRDLAVRFFPGEMASPLRVVRDRRSAIALGIWRLRSALKPLGKRARGLVQREYAVRGKFDSHTFDIAIEYKRPLLVADALSFEVGNEADLNRDIDAVAWAVDDVRKNDKTLPLSVLAVGLGSHADAEKRTRRILKGLGARLISEQQIGSWARDAALITRRAQPTKERELFH